jgi:hypothetical protein
MIGNKIVSRKGAKAAKFVKPGDFWLFGISWG